MSNEELDLTNECIGSGRSDKSNSCKIEKIFAKNHRKHHHHHKSDHEDSQNGNKKIAPDPKTIQECFKLMKECYNQNSLRKILTHSQTVNYLETLQKLTKYKKDFKPKLCLHCWTLFNTELTAAQKKDHSLLIDLNKLLHSDGYESVFHSSSVTWFRFSEFLLNYQKKLDEDHDEDKEYQFYDTLLRDMRAVQSDYDNRFYMKPFLWKEEYEECAVLKQRRIDEGLDDTAIQKQRNKNRRNLNDSIEVRYGALKTMKQGNKNMTKLERWNSIKVNIGEDGGTKNVLGKGFEEKDNGWGVPEEDDEDGDGDGESEWWGSQRNSRMRRKHHGRNQRPRNRYKQWNQRNEAFLEDVEQGGGFRRWRDVPRDEPMLGKRNRGQDLPSKSVVRASWASAKSKKTKVDVVSRDSPSPIANIYEELEQQEANKRSRRTKSPSKGGPRRNRGSRLESLVSAPPEGQQQFQPLRKRQNGNNHPKQKELVTRSHQSIRKKNKTEAILVDSPMKSLPKIRQLDADVMTRTPNKQSGANQEATKINEDSSSNKSKKIDSKEKKEEKSNKDELSLKRMKRLQKSIKILKNAQKSRLKDIKELKESDEKKNSRIEGLEEENSALKKEVSVLTKKVNEHTDLISGLSKSLKKAKNRQTALEKFTKKRLESLNKKLKFTRKKKDESEEDFIETTTTATTSKKTKKVAPSKKPKVVKKIKIEPNLDAEKSGGDSESSNHNDEKESLYASSGQNDSLDWDYNQQMRDLGDLGEGFGDLDEPDDFE